MLCPGMTSTLARLVAICLLAAGFSRPPDTPAANLVLTGGVIHTFDAARSRAAALAVRDGRIVSVLEEYLPTDRGIYAIYPHRRYLPAKVRTFVDFLHAWFRRNPGIEA